MPVRPSLSLSSHRHACHLPTGISALPADLPTSLHLCVFAEVFAFGGALFTNGGAGATGLSVKSRAAKHKVGACLANFCAIEQEAKMTGFSVIAARLQTIGDDAEANYVAILTIANAFLHFCIVLL